MPEIESPTEQKSEIQSAAQIILTQLGGSGILSAMVGAKNRTEEKTNRTEEKNYKEKKISFSTLI